MKSLKGSARLTTECVVKIKTYHVNMLKKYHQIRGKSREVKITMDLKTSVSQK